MGGRSQPGRRMTGALALRLVKELCADQAREPQPDGTLLGQQPTARQQHHESAADQVAIVAVHGGAGATTVAALLQAKDSGQCWPKSDDTLCRHIVLTARTSAAGLKAASLALAERDPRVIGLVLVPDVPGRLPSSLKRRVMVLASVTMVMRLPWVKTWRLNEVTPDPEEEVQLARRLRDFTELARAASGTKQRGD